MNGIQVFGDGSASALTPIPAPIPIRSRTPAPSHTSHTPLKTVQSSDFTAPASPAKGFPMQRSNSGYTRAEGKRKADEGTDATTAKRLKDASATIASKLQSNTIRDLSEKVDVLLEVCRLLLRRDLARDNNLSQDADIRVKPLLKDIEPEPGSAIAKLTAGY
jgi:hypothetical protein